MHHVKRVLACVLMLTVIFGCALSASADGTQPQPDEHWYEEHLLTELPSDEKDVFSEFVPLEEPEVKEDADNYIVSAEPCEDLKANTVYTATVNLYQVTEDEKPVWKIDREHPLAIEDPKQERDEDHALPENDEELTAPTDEELAELIGVKGWCGSHGETELDLEKVTFDVVVYKDEDGTVRARVTFEASKIAEAVTEARKAPHSAASLRKLKVEYTLAPEEKDYALTHVELRFVTPDYVTVVYEDGLDGVVFQKEVYRVAPYTQTPASKIDGSDPESLRRGYYFAGWDPERTELAEADVTYTARWWAVNYTITYVGVPAGVENPNPATYTIRDEVILQGLDTDGFVCWLDEKGQEITSIPKGSSGNRVLTAKIIEKPTMPKIGTNVSEDLLKIQCTNHEEHTWTNSTAFSTNYRNLKWNAETKRWETYVTVSLNQINLTQIKNQHFGGITHYYEKNNPVVNVYFDPDAQGTTSLGAPVTGQWFAMDGNPVVLDVECYDVPAAPKTVTTKLWVRDWTKLANYEKTTKLISGTYTVGDVYGDRTNGFFVDVTINDLSAYISTKMAAKTTGTYIVDPVQNGKTIAYRMKYTGSLTDLKQDGSGWTIYTNEWTGQEKNNGKTIWVLPQWTTTYRDGADGEAFADKVIVYPETSNDVSQDILKTGSIATPSFGVDPKRTGYTFLGWEPAVSEKLTADAVYTAKWIENPKVPSGTNSAKALFKFHCTVDSAHADQTYNWFGSYVKYNGDLSYDSARGVFTATANITNVQTLLSAGTKCPEKVWGMKHYHTDANGNTVRTATIRLVWDPNAAGPNASGTETTGLWVPDGEQTVDVWCATEPAAPKLSLMTPSSMRNTTAIRVISVDEPWGTKATQHNVPTYFRYLTSGTYTISPVEKDENGDFWATLVIDPTSYLEAFNRKNSSEPAYWVDEEKTTTDFTYRLKYMGSKTNYAIDGSGWTVDKSSYLPGETASGSKVLYVTNKYNVIYTDGVEDAEVFADQTYRVVSGGKTPAFDGTPQREGYTFEGWTPEVAETVTANVTYTAQWTAVPYSITYVGVPEGVENPNPDTYTIEGLTLTDLAVDGFLGWDDGNGNVLTAIPAGTTGDLTLTAKFATVPSNGPGNGNSVMNDAEYPWIKFHCTTVGDHGDYSLLTLWGNCYDLTYTWDSARKAYVGTATVKLSTLLDYSTGYVVKAMGGIRHYSVDGLETVTVHGIWIVDETSAKGGLWYPDGETPVVNIKCNTEPAAPTVEQLGSGYTDSTKLWVRDWTNTSNWVRQTKLLPGTFTVGQMVKQPSNPNSRSTTWTIPITITNLEPYAQLLAGKSTGTYTVDTLQTTASLTYELKYTFTPSSSLEPDQTGTKWKLNMSGTEASQGKEVWVLPQWTITYTDGVGGKVFADKTFVVPASSADIAQNGLKNGSLATPAFGEDPVRSGCTFLGWSPELSDKVTDSVTYTAQWQVEAPAVPSGTNSAKELFKFHCTKDEGHGDQTYNWFGSYVKYNGDMAYDAERGVYTASANITNVQTLLSAGTKCPEKVWGMKHYHTDASGNTVRTATIHLVWDPDAVGPNAAGTETAGLWVPDGEQLVNVWCANAPAAPKLTMLTPKSQQTTAAIRVLSVDEPLGNTATNHNVPTYFKYLVSGTYSISPVAKDANGDFWATLVIDPSYYLAAFNNKNSSEPAYWVDNERTTSNFTYRLRYTGSKTNFAQDGSGWTVDNSSYLPGETMKNSKILYVTNKYEVTYTDGVADTEVFADQKYQVASGSATPAFAGTPEREGYTFEGWSPEVAETVTGNVTYTAVWAEAEEEALEEGEEPVEPGADEADEVVEPLDPESPEEPADPVQSGEGEQTPAQPGEGEQTPAQPGEGEQTPAQPGEGGQTPAQPGEGEQTPAQPGEGEQTPAQPGEGEQTPAQPGEGEQTPAQPSEGEQKPAQPGDGEQKPTQPGEGEKTPTQPEKPPVAPQPPVVQEPAPVPAPPVEEPAPDPEKDNG